jgi:hypothetical protein
MAGPPPQKEHTGPHRGLERLDWGDDDYAVVDGETRVGRIYREMLLGKMKWRWFLQTVPATPPNQGVADTLDEAKAAFRQRYEQVKGPRAFLASAYRTFRPATTLAILQPEN